MRERHQMLLRFSEDVFTQCSFKVRRVSTDDSFVNDKVLDVGRDFAAESIGLGGAYSNDDSVCPVTARISGDKWNWNDHTEVHSLFMISFHDIQGCSQEPLARKSVREIIAQYELSEDVIFGRWW